MSDAAWGLFGVGVGALVTFGTTLWQLNRARDSEANAYAEERTARRNEREAAALAELQEALGRWYSETLNVVGSAFDVEKPTSVEAVEAFLAESPVERHLTVLTLIQRCHDDSLRIAVRDFLSSTMDKCQELLGDGDIQTRAGLYDAMVSSAGAYRELLDSVGARLRSLE